MTLPRPKEPGTKETGPVVHYGGGSQAKNKKLSPQKNTNKKDKERYRRTVKAPNV